MAFDINTKTTDLIAALEESTGINQKEELRQILQNKNVNVSDTDDMNTLVNKVNDIQQGYLPGDIINITHFELLSSPGNVLYSTDDNVVDAMTYIMTDSKDNIHLRCGQTQTWGDTGYVIYDSKLNSIKAFDLSSNIRFSTTMNIDNDDNVYFDGLSDINNRNIYLFKYDNTFNIVKTLQVNKNAVGSTGYCEINQNGYVAMIVTNDDNYNTLQLYDNNFNLIYATNITNPSSQINQIIKLFNNNIVKLSNGDYYDISGNKITNSSLYPQITLKESYYTCNRYNNLLVYISFDSSNSQYIINVYDTNTSKFLYNFNVSISVCIIYQVRYGVKLGYTMGNNFIAVLGITRTNDSNGNHYYSEKIMTFSNILPTIQIK